MEINSLEDLRAKENLIRRMLQRCRLDSVLLGLRSKQGQDSIGRYPPLALEPFMLAGVAMFALRYCPPRPARRYYAPLPESELVSLVRHVSEYLLADPVSFDPDLRDEYQRANPALTFLRLVAPQFDFKISPYGQFARSLVLYEDTPTALAARRDVPRFDFAGAFEAVNGVPMRDFVKVAWMAWLLAGKTDRLGFSRSDFERARARGMDLPQASELSSVLDQLAITPEEFRAEYDRHRGEDPKFAMYDFNPLFSYPIVRPHGTGRMSLPDEDAMVAPVPDSIVSRVSVGVFYQMFDRYKTEFSRYFGHLFGEYVGTVLRHSVPLRTLLAEEEVRKTYPETRGKVPDWAIVDGCTAVLIECKATRFTRPALTTGGVEAVNDSLKQALKGLVQLDEFIRACREKRPGLEPFHSCTRFEPVLVTPEPLHLINSVHFRDYVDDLLLARKGVRNLPWMVIPVNELEVLQPHLASGISVGGTVAKLRGATFNEVLEGLIEQTGCTYKDSFLYSKEEQIHRMLGT